VGAGGWVGTFVGAIVGTTGEPERSQARTKISMNEIKTNFLFMDFLTSSGFK
jgi:hypothetical protein